MNKKIILASASPRRQELDTDRTGFRCSGQRDRGKDHIHRACESGGRTVSAEGGSGVGEACGKWCLLIRNRKVEKLR